MPGPDSSLSLIKCCSSREINPRFLSSLEQHFNSFCLINLLLSSDPLCSFSLLSLALCLLSTNTLIWSLYLIFHSPSPPGQMPSPPRQRRPCGTRSVPSWRRPTASWLSCSPITARGRRYERWGAQRWTGKTKYWPTKFKKQIVLQKLVYSLLTFSHSLKLQPSWHVIRIIYAAASKKSP